MTFPAVPIAAPFAAPFPVRSIDDVRRLESRPLAEAVPVASTYELIRNSAAAFGGRTALAFLRSADPADEPVRLSYDELLAGVHQTANLLHSLGVGPGDAVGVLLPGCLEYHLALWGGEAAAIVQPLNPLLADEKLASLLRTSGAKALIAWGSDDESGIWSKALKLKAGLPSLKVLLRVAPHGEAEEVTEAEAASWPEGVADFGRLRSRQPGDRLASGRHIAAADIAAYFHTGGTTGAPKLARHSHGAQVFSAWACVMLHGVKPHDVAINGYPLFHVAGVLSTSLAALAAGAETIIPTTSLLRNREVLRNYWRLVEKHRATTLSAVPTALAALANMPLDGADISSIRFCRTGASPLPAELAARFERQFGLHVHESFGMTEMAGISTVTPPGVHGPAGCVGFRLPYSQLRIVALDERGGASGRELPRGEAGMVLFRSPNLFSGFLDPADDAQAFTADGWLATGDLGWLDDEERLHLSGRSKDLIIRSGHNIDPKLVEDALGAHPAVQLCAAVGAPDAYAGELPVLFATLLPGAVATEEELRIFAAGRVDEAPARPRSVTVLEHMPMTNVGKIFKPELRLLAARAIVAGLVEEVCREAAAPPPRPQVAIDATRQTVVVTVDAALPAHEAEALRRAVRDKLAPLPCRTQVQ